MGHMMERVRTRVSAAMSVRRVWLGERSRKSMSGKARRG